MVWSGTAGTNKTSCDSAAQKPSDYTATGRISDDDGGGKVGVVACGDDGLGEHSIERAWFAPDGGRLARQVNLNAADAVDPLQRSGDAVDARGAGHTGDREANGLGHIVTINPKLIRITAVASPTLIHGELERFQRPSRPSTRLLLTASNRISSGMMKARL